MMQTIGSHNAKHFKNTMISTFQDFINRRLVTPAAKIVDLGCGCGRIAIPFAAFLESGRYYGIDVWPEGLQWCTENLTVRNPNMTFILNKSRNNYYFGDWDPDIRNDYRLPGVQSGDIDFLFAISTFTHLTQADCQSYLHEVARVLNVGGLAYISCFIIDRFFFGYVEKTGLHKAVQKSDFGFYYAYSGQDFFAGYQPDQWRNMVEEAGLEIICQEPGRWSEKPGSKYYQDTYILTRRGDIPL